jgi:hypothetical protein
MTVLIKYPRQTKKTNEDFFKRKNQELTNLDWAKWAGWFDTDGWFRLNKKNQGKSARLYLKDRQPVELFSKTFETSLTFREHKTITPEPYRYEYTCVEHMVSLSGEKVIWFTKNVYPYLIKEEKKDYAAKLLGYRPESKDFTTWTNDETVHYLATVIEGDGSFWVSGKKNSSIATVINSSDTQYLANIQSLSENKLGITSTLFVRTVYKTQKGIKTKYGIRINGSLRNSNNLGFFKNLVKDNVMTLDRKKQKVQKFVTCVS